MNRVLGIAVVIGMVASVPAPAARQASGHGLSPQLQALSIAGGKWTYHGDNFATSDQKAGKWDWSEDCGWSSNQAFMTCSFTMHWPDKVVKSQVVNTYNHGDNSYWHYEMFDSEGSGAEPFISRMTISGSTWTNYGKADKKTYRVIYRYTSATHVTVTIEQSTDRNHWTIMARGEGVKQS